LYEVSASAIGETGKEKCLMEALKMHRDEDKREVQSSI
jgi:hypothetical protein